MQTDLVLLHAPAVYDFRERSVHFGPIADLVPATPIFDIYPMGLTTIAEYLERNGHYVRIFNLAYLMLRSKRFDVERTIRSMTPKLFGIDLHWMPHCHGAIEVAKICKRLHPDIPVVLGGHSSSVFHEELLTYDCIDYVLRGDSTEEPMRQLMDALPKKGGVCPSSETLASIPNLSWRDSTGTIIVNELSWSPDTFNLPALDFSYNMKSVIRYRDFLSGLPFKQWLSAPMTASIVCRGCTRDCVTCGGSVSTYRKYYGRKKVAFRDPELIVRDLAHATKFIPGSVFLLNDPIQAGSDYCRALIEGLGKLKLKQSIGFELFSPPSEEMLDLMAEHLNDWSIEISVETHDDALRKTFGKGQYTTAEIEENVCMALAKGVTRYDLFYLAGIPGQDAQSVLDTVDYLDGLYERTGNDKRVLAFVAPMTPFLDVGSIAFDNPEKYGYRLRAKTLTEHRELLLEPSWKQIMNYESLTLPTDDLGQVIYEAARRVNDLKERVGITDATTAAAMRARIDAARVSMDEVDAVLSLPQEQQAHAFAKLEEESAPMANSTLYESDDLNWPSNATVGNTLSCIALGLIEEFMKLLTWGKRHAISKPHEEYRATENT